MNLDLTDEEQSFREEARTWLREHLPTEPRPPEGQEMREFDLAWQRTLFDGGWAGINWPAEFGGRGLSDIQQMIWYEEFATADPPFTLANSCTFVGNMHGGPTLIVNGTEQSGLSAELRAACVQLVRLPMRGRADSLNLSVAAGIMLYAVWHLQEAG